MAIRSPEGINFPHKRPDRRWIRFFVKYYAYLVGIGASLIIVTSLYLIDPKVMLVALAGYWIYLVLRVRNRSNPKLVFLYHSISIQFIRTLFLIVGVSLLLAYV